MERADARISLGHELGEPCRRQSEQDNHRRRREPRPAIPGTGQNDGQPDADRINGGGNLRNSAGSSPLRETPAT